MNTYREDIILIQLATKHLVSLLIQLCEGQGQKSASEVMETTEKRAQSQDTKNSTASDGEVTEINVVKLKYLHAKLNQHFPTPIEGSVKHWCQIDKHDNLKYFQEFEITLSKVLTDLEKSLVMEQEMSVSTPFLDASLYKSSVTNIYRTLQLVGVARCLRSDNLTKICDSLMEKIKFKLSPDSFLLNTLLYENVTIPM